MTSLTHWDAQDKADGIIKYGGDMLGSAVVFKCWLCDVVVSHPEYKKYGKESTELIEKIWALPEIKDAFDRMGVHIQPKTLRNYLPNFSRTALPRIKEKGFEDGVGQAITNYGGGKLLRGESPERGHNSKCQGACGECGKKCNK